METRITGKKILAVGLGLIGGSVAKALRAAGCQNIDGLDTNTKTLKQALADNVIGSIYSPGEKTYDIVICSLPHRIVPSVYSQIKDSLESGGVFAELSGLKSCVTRCLCTIMCEQHVLLSLHPMAGSEKTGYINSSVSLMHGAPIILTPTEKTNETALSWAGFIARALNCGEMITLSAKRHDEAIAAVSHLPHITALALWKTGKHSARCAGGSFHSATRVANLNASLWAGLLTDNAEYLLNSLEHFKQCIDTLEQAVRTKDAAALEKQLCLMAKTGDAP